MPTILHSLLTARINHHRILGNDTHIIIQIWPETSCNPEYEETWIADDSGKWFLTDTWEPYGVPAEYQQVNFYPPLTDLPSNKWEELFPE
jgi:hypothetical protein